jgi:RNA polymerase primary sigma factor
MYADSWIFKEIGKHKLLTREEEIALATRARAGDKAARDKMVLSNLRLAVKIAKDFHNKSSCSLEDLIQESNLGLVKAVDLFDPTRGFKFSTYACWWMKQRVRQHILSTSGIARLPGNARMLVYQAKRARKDYEEEFGTSPTIDELADILNVSSSQLRGVLSCSSIPKSMDAPTRTSEGEGRLFHETIEDESLEDPGISMDNEKVLSAIYKCLSSLTPREQLVMRLRFGLLDDLRDDPRFAASNLILEESNR